MKKDDFLELVKDISSKIMDTLMNKGADYSGDYDRFANFKLITAITGDRPIVMTPLLSCKIRQLDKIQRCINLLISGEAAVSEEKMDDTLLDDIGYGYIGYGIWQEMKAEKKVKEGV